mgnify:CR=1 FL=1
MTSEMMDNSVARAHDFFDVGSSLEMGLGGQNAFGLEGANHFVGESFGFMGFEDSFFNPSQFGGMGLSAQDSLDLLMTHEGTEVLLNGMDTGFNSFQEELCCDYMAGVRAGLIGMDVSHIEHSFSEIPLQMGHADGDYRAAAFAEGVAFANEFMGIHGSEPSFMDCLESYNDGQIAHDIADMARLEDQLYAHECEMAHYRGLLEAQPDNEWAQQQYQESEARYNDLGSEFNHKSLSFYGKTKDSLPSDANSDGYIHKGNITLTRTVSDSKDTFKHYTKDGHDYVLYYGRYIQVDGNGTVRIGNIKYDKV